MGLEKYRGEKDNSYINTSIVIHENTVRHPEGLCCSICGSSYIHYWKEI